MDEAQRRSRLNRIARRVRYIERAPDLEPDAVAELATTVQASKAAGARWIALGDALGRYGRPFWRGQW